MSINRNERQVTVDVPEELCLGHAPDVVGVALSAGADQGDGVVVKPVTGTLSPEEIPVEDEGGAFGEVEVEARIEVYKVGRADEASLAEIGTLRKEGVERLQVRIILKIVLWCSCGTLF